jgi:senataxin
LLDNIIQNPEILKPFFEKIRDRYNPGQYRSIKEITFIKQGICMLQGPPGTGKTHTLLGLVSGVYMHMKKLNKFPQKKILICAPSNAAIDEIIVRILKGGIINENGGSERVEILRLGLRNEDSEMN